MIFLRMIASDIKNGIFKNFRYVFIAIIAALNFGVARILCSKSNADTDFFTLLDKALSINYFSLTVLFFATFICLDFIHKSFVSSGVQILYRTKNKATFYLAKCVFCVASALYTWAIFLLAFVLLSSAYGYSFEIPFDTTSGFLSLKAQDLVLFTFSPILVLISLNILQMLFLLLMKPIFAYLANALFILIGVFSNIEIFFAHIGVNFYIDLVYKNEFDIKKSLAICIFATAICVIIGTLFFKKCDILPDKEEN